MVRTLAWGGSGYDGLYLISEDLLQHRKVKLLVFYDENVELGEQLRNGALTSLFRLSEQTSVWSRLPIKDQAAYYVVALMGMPRTLLSLISLNIPAELFPNHPGYIQPQNKGFIEAPRHMGTVYVHAGFSPTFFNAKNSPFQPYYPTEANESDGCIYSPSNNSVFEFSNAPLPAWHLQFAKAFGALANNCGCQLVMLDIPVYEERRNTVISERAFWPGFLSTNLLMLGLPPIKMFGSMTDEEVQYLFGDPQHLNQNGQRYFTRLITPTRLKLYETSTNH